MPQPQKLQPFGRPLPTPAASGRKIAMGMTLLTDLAKIVEIGPVRLSNNLPMAVIAGPCQIEGLDHSLEMAGTIAEICRRAGIPFIFKSSFDKANRTSLAGVRGPGIADGLEILSEVKRQVGCPVLTDIHDPAQAATAALQVDVIQIPAFLCRQTDLLLAAGKTGAAINVKKGQFLAPWEMQNVADKILSTGNDRIMLCERGTSFGYNMLVNDIRSLPIMAKTGFPVIIDATHSVQEPGGRGQSSGGRREFAPAISRAAVAVGVAAVFIETHEDPDHAPSDGPNMIHLSKLPDLLETLKSLDLTAKSSPIIL